jgi:two-component system chemotaxis sensor kinase CheA
MSFSPVQSRFKSPVEWMMPRGLLDHEAARGSRLVARVGLLVLAVSLMMQVKYYGEGAHLIVTMTWACIAIQLLGMVLHRATGSYRVGAHILCLSMWALFFGISAASGGIESPNLIANFFIVVVAPMLLGRRHGLIWLGVVIITGIAQFVLASRGLSVQTLPPEHLALTRLSEFIATSGTVGLTAYFYAKVQERMRGAVAHEKHVVDLVNADLRVILDNSGQGFLSLDPQGRLIGERSAIVDSWLKDAKNGRSFSELLGALDPVVAGSFASGWSQLQEAVLPLELALDQLPKRVVAAGMTLQLEYRPVAVANEAFQKLVVIISDISAEVTRAEAETRQRDLLEGFERILRDPDGFSLFLKTARRDVDAIVSGHLTDGALLRSLHTLKGNSAVMGLSALAQTCHDLEDVLASERTLGPEELRSLERELATVEGRLGNFVALNARDVDLRKDEWEAFLSELSRKKSHRELARIAKSWGERRVERHFARLAEYAEQLAERLERGALQVRVEGGELRMPERFDDFWDVAVHVVRNAIDHGVESAEERRLLDKGPGVLVFRAFLVDEHQVVEIQDDGRGIAWEKIREQARARGLPAESAGDLLDALLTDGLSTSESVSEISGRGVGMGSVRKVCGNLGIRIAVESAAGAGSVFRFTFPKVETSVSVLSSSA